MILKFATVQQVNIVINKDITAQQIEVIKKTLSGFGIPCTATIAFCGEELNILHLTALSQKYGFKNIVFKIFGIKNLEEPVSRITNQHLEVWVTGDENPKFLDTLTRVKCSIRWTPTTNELNEKFFMTMLNNWPGVSTVLDFRSNLTGHINNKDFVRQVVKDTFFALKEKNRGIGIILPYIKKYLNYCVYKNTIFLYPFLDNNLWLSVDGQFLDDELNPINQKITSVDELRQFCYKTVGIPKTYNVPSMLNEFYQLIEEECNRFIGTFEVVDL